MSEIISFVVDLVSQMGYGGIIVTMALESSFFPFPSEVVIVPAGYLASQGEMNIYIVILSGILGSLIGATLNYYLALKFGEKFLLRFGKYIFFKQHHLDKVKTFFRSHGEISTFNGRLIPVIRQYISFPAGLAGMKFQKFVLFTALGAGVWCVVLALMGYIIGDNKELIHQNLRMATIISILFIIVLSTIYIWYKKRAK